MARAVDNTKLYHRPNCLLFIQIQKAHGFKFTPGVGPAVPQQCPETGANFLMGGPFWADPIHNMDWVQGILQSVKVSQSIMNVHHNYCNISWYLLCPCSEPCHMSVLGFARPAVCPDLTQKLHQWNECHSHLGHRNALAQLPAGHCGQTASLQHK